MSKNNKHWNNGLDDRCRHRDGEIRQKRGDTLVSTLRKRYGQDFAPECAGTRGLILYANDRAAIRSRRFFAIRTDWNEVSTRTIRL